MQSNPCHSERSEESLPRSPQHHVRETKKRSFTTIQSEGLPGVNFSPDAKGHQEKVAGDKEHPQQEEQEHLLAIKTCYIHGAILPSSKPLLRA